MYAAHFAAGLAVKSRAPAAPAWALLTGAFLPDLAWIALAAAGVEPTGAANWFDGWSHSLVSILFQATVFGALFRRRGWRVVLAVWAAVFSHFLLDLPIHPRPLEAWPHSPVSLGWDLWRWGLARSPIGMTNYWWIQSGAVGALLAIYLAGARKAAIPWNLAAASALIVIGLHFIL